MFSFLILSLSLALVGLVARCLSSCCVVCDLHVDEFSTDTIANYNQRSGTHTISGGSATTSSAGALLICNTAVPAGVNKLHCSGVFTPAGTGGIATLIFAYVDDDNYWFAEVKQGPDNPTGGTLKLFKRASGTNTQQTATVVVLNYVAGNQGRMRLCYDGETVTVTFRETSSTVCFTTAKTASVTIAGTKCGIGTGAGSSGSVACDSFKFNRHPLDKAGCEHCDDCPAQVVDCVVCHEGTTRAQLLVELYDWEDNGLPGVEVDCPNMNGFYVVQFQESSGTASEGFCKWRYTFQSPPTCNGSSVAYIQLMRKCFSGNCDWELSAFDSSDGFIAGTASDISDTNDECETGDANGLVIDMSTVVPSEKATVWVLD